MRYPLEHEFFFLILALESEALLKNRKLKLSLGNTKKVMFSGKPKYRYVVLNSYFLNL